jgi:hypothetical protein
MYKYKYKYKCSGAAVTFKMDCSNNHSTKWDTSEFFQNRGPGRPKSKLNMMISSFLLMAGLHYDSAKVSVVVVH